MKQDEQLKNLAECSGCGMKCGPGVPLVRFYTKSYCGNCYPKVRDAHAQIMLEEVEKRAFQK